KFLLFRARRALPARQRPRAVQYFSRSACKQQRKYKRDATVRFKAKRPNRLARFAIFRFRNAAELPQTDEKTSGQQPGNKQEQDARDVDDGRPRRAKFLARVRNGFVPPERRLCPACRVVSCPTGVELRSVRCRPARGCPRSGYHVGQPAGVTHPWPRRAAAR